MLLTTVLNVSNTNTNFAGHKLPSLTIQLSSSSLLSSVTKESSKNKFLRIYFKTSTNKHPKPQG